jgi:hypothetical protein
MDVLRREERCEVEGVGRDSGGMAVLSRLIEGRRLWGR